MKEEEVKRCQIQEWYPRFKPHSIKTLIHELPESFIQYLLQDSGPFLLPLSISGEDALPRRKINNLDSDSIIPSDSESESNSDSDSDSESPTAPSFPDLESEIKSSIETLGGAIFPKLNWSAPKDAAWISTTGTLRCTSFADICLLLRSSDSAVHDLCHAFDSCSDKSTSRPSKFFIALRKWYPSLRPEMEFRCFVRLRRLVGISQREVTIFYPALIEKKLDLELSIGEFFEVNVKSEFELEDYVFDVYVTKDGRVKVIDFNPWGGFTLPLMFSWEELEENFRNGGEGGVEFRIVESRCGVRPGLKSAVPYDYLDMSPGSGWDQFLRGADEEFRRQAKSPEAGG
ncbi:temperature sensing protein-like protein [Tasmannia lanceolata]|uniref:temperature sensing protein-like protein n=1 Tax=Tasmannia lanceolata TaxID=3420 RepID=UPI004062A5F7